MKIKRKFIPYTLIENLGLKPRYPRTAVLILSHNSSKLPLFYWETLNGSNFMDKCPQATFPCVTRNR
jgi:hypothetical protein